MVARAPGSFDKAGSKKMTQLTAGIDVSKKTLDVALHGRPERFTFANDRAGWAALADAFAEVGVMRVGLEATGGYERGVMDHLWAEGCAVHLLQPVQVKAFAKLQRRKAKNDRLDAVLIAALTASLADTAARPDRRLAALADELTFLEQIEEDIARLKTRLEHAGPRVARLVRADIARLALRKKAETARLAAGLRRHDDLARRFALIGSVRGIGPRTALSLVIRLPELGSASREQIAALAGLAPFDDDSGERHGARHIQGGRKRLRRALYAAALPAAFRWNPALIALYKRLVAKGKGHKRALVACARKLLIYANAVVARGTPWTDRSARAT
jgi:transposase